MQKGFRSVQNSSSYANFNIHTKFLLYFSSAKYSTLQSCCGRIQWLVCHFTGNFETNKKKVISCTYVFMYFGYIQTYNATHVFRKQVQCTKCVIHYSMHCIHINQMYSSFILCMYSHILYRFLFSSSVFGRSISRGC